MVYLPHPVHNGFEGRSGSPLSVIWEWSLGKVIPAVVTEETFDPGETKTLTIIWNQTHNNGTPVGTGNFAAQGFIGVLSELKNQNKSLDATEARSPLVNFTIN